MVTHAFRSFDWQRKCLMDKEQKRLQHLPGEPLDIGQQQQWWGSIAVNRKSTKQWSQTPARARDPEAAAARLLWQSGWEPGFAWRAREASRIWDLPIQLNNYSAMSGKRAVDFKGHTSGRTGLIARSLHAVLCGGAVSAGLKRQRRVGLFLIDHTELIPQEGQHQLCIL